MIGRYTILSFTPYDMKLQNKYLGSTVTIIIGGLMIAVALSNAGQGIDPGTSLEGGIAAILGAYAYRSAKERKLGLAKTNAKSIVVEGLGLCVAVLLLLLGITVAQKAAFETPIGLVVIPLWTIAAYLAIFLYNPTQTNASFFKRHKPWLIAVLFFILSFLLQSYLSFALLE